ncbi:MAG: hypothetical protein QY318_04655 [Candidatus Dojkabacteria bacterium]|nr:MAG: hypothetical protein QY318_04655 [Candidatus Dojkabacteria bacterium]
MDWLSIGLGILLGAVVFIVIAKLFKFALKTAIFITVVVLGLYFLANYIF